MRAKFVLKSVLSTEYGDELKFSAVCSDNFGANGESEDNTYARYTPMAELTMKVNNPALIGKFRPGAKFYVDFTEIAIKNG